MIQDLAELKQAIDLMVALKIKDASLVQKRFLQLCSKEATNPAETNLKNLKLLIDYVRCALINKIHGEEFCTVCEAKKPIKDYKTIKLYLENSIERTILAGICPTCNNIISVTLNPL